MRKFVKTRFSQILDQIKGRCFFGGKHVLFYINYKFFSSITFDYFLYLIIFVIVKDLAIMILTAHMLINLVSNVR